MMQTEQEIQQVSLTFSPAAAKYAASRGWDLNDVAKWVKESAIISHPDGNRRYHDFIFRVKGTEVLSITPYVPDTTSIFLPSKPEEAGKFKIIEDCPSCEGEGCPNCDNKGTVSRVRWA